ncbi:MAG: septum site-determining protein MinD, partial [Proteobacteria bacterium]
PEVSSVRDSDRILGMLGSKTLRAEQGKDPVKEHLVITRFNPNRANTGEMLSVEDIRELLAIPLLGVIPESESVLSASNLGTPVVMDDSSQAGQAYRDCVRRYLGADLPHRFLEVRKSGLMSRLFGR